MKKATFVVLLLLSSQCVADTLKATIDTIESEWASIYYTISPKKQGAAYQRLLDKTTALSRQYPNKAEILFWQAVLKATYADNQDAMSALAAIYEARDLLLEAIKIDPNTMDGSAYVTLGTLYYMAPKWPIAFGDENEARKMLETALTINPNGIDTNYFFGDFLLATDRPAEAIKYFEKAAGAPVRKEQVFADTQLKAEARNALKNAQERRAAGGKGMFLSLFTSKTSIK